MHTGSPRLLASSSVTRGWQGSRSSCFCFDGALWMYQVLYRRGLFHSSRELRRRSTQMFVSLEVLRFRSSFFCFPNDWILTHAYPFVLYSHGGVCYMDDPDSLPYCDCSNAVDLSTGKKYGTSRDEVTSTHSPLGRVNTFCEPYLYSLDWLPSFPFATTRQSDNIVNKSKRIAIVIMWKILPLFAWTAAFVTMTSRKCNLGLKDDFGHK